MQGILQAGEETTAADGKLIHSHRPNPKGAIPRVNGQGDYTLTGRYIGSGVPAFPQPGEEKQNGEKGEGGGWVEGKG